MILTQRLENCLNLIVVNLKLNTLSNLVFSIAFLCAVPLLQGISYLGKGATAVCLENYAAIIGIILLASVFAPEESKNIDEIISSKATPIFKPYVVRTVLAVMSILVLVFGFCIVLKYNSCTFPFSVYIFGTFASALFLGAIGMFISSLSGSTIIGYMSSIGYLIIIMMTGNKYVGKFYILSMKDNSFIEKYYILVGGIVLCIIAIFVKQIKRRVLI